MRLLISTRVGHLAVRPDSALHLLWVPFRHRRASPALRLLLPAPTACRLALRGGSYRHRPLVRMGDRCRPRLGLDGAEYKRRKSTIQDHGGMHATDRPSTAWFGGSWDNSRATRTWLLQGVLYGRLGVTRQLRLKPASAPMVHCMMGDDTLNGG